MFFLMQYCFKELFGPVSSFILFQTNMVNALLTKYNFFVATIGFTRLECFVLKKSSEANKVLRGIV